MEPPYPMDATYPSNPNYQQGPRPLGFEGLVDQPTPPYPPAPYANEDPERGSNRNLTPVETNDMDNGSSGPGADRGREFILNPGEEEEEEGEGEDSGEIHELHDKRETVYFRDGKKRIDFILSYHDLTDPKKIDRKKMFEDNMLAEGLEIETEDKHNWSNLSQNGKTHFIKVHATWDVLSRMAELMSMKMPIQEYDEVFKQTDCCPCLPNPFEVSDDIVKSEPDYFTADFNREREDMFVIEDKETFFTPAQRSMIVGEVLLRLQYEPSKDKFGIDRLLKQGVYTSAFPLHEGPYHSSRSILASGPLNDRHLLYEAWARPGRWCYKQPLDQIRRYFGEKVGIYFAWLGFYTTMLIPASIVGLIVFIYGLATMGDNVSSLEICDRNHSGNFVMCPLCDRRCPYWRLVSSCTYARLTYLFDNGATVFFAGFMAIWSTTFLEFWKRKQAEILYDWDLVGYELEEHMRPDFEAKTQTMKLNPVTQMMEPYLPWYNRIPRKVTSFIVVIFMICCVLAAVFGVIMYRIIMITLLYSADEDIIKQNAKITTTATAALINLIVIMLLNRVYTVIAVWLTDLERPRTDSDYEDSFTFKMFLFQFINYYAAIFYIAFFKGRFRGYPGHSDYQIGKWKMDECDPAGCLIELCIQLAIVMVGKQAFNNFKEIMLPVIMNWFRSRTAKKRESEENLYTRWEQDKDLTDVPNMGLFDEYLEMVIQYGFVTIFVAAFPLAPLFALMNNVIEVRLDAYKLVTQWKRPIASRAQDIGIWFPILQGLSFLAVLTNAFIIGWTSDFVPKLVYLYTESEDGSLSGYINSSLSVFNVSDFQERSRPEESIVRNIGNVTLCRYSDYRLPPWDENKYDFTTMYWHVFTARLAFIIVFEHVVFLVTWLIAYVIPDVPGRVKQLMLREYHIAKEAKYNAAFSSLRKDIKDRKESNAKIA